MCVLYGAPVQVIDKFLATYGDKSGDFLLGKDFSC